MLCPRLLAAAEILLVMSTAAPALGISAPRVHPAVATQLAGAGSADVVVLLASPAPVSARRRSALVQAQTRRVLASVPTMRLRHAFALASGFAGSITPAELM